MPAIPTMAVIRATPALWEIRDADTTIYLFGSFHAVDGRTVWMENEVRKAFNTSEELVLEAVPPSDPAEVQRIAATAGANRSIFMNGMRTAMSQARASGMSVQSGTDAVLRRLAEASGKKVSGLEEFGDQLRALSSITATTGSSPAIGPVRPVSMTSLLDSWRSGDGAAFAMVIDSLQSRSPQVYDALIARPNARWGQWIADRLQQPGTVFVAVGSGHLAGKDSVQQWLAARGIAANRVS
jgi:uncharacterized protein YbaP (TraB family)